MNIYVHLSFCFQLFDTVGWVSGRAYDLQREITLVHGFLEDVETTGDCQLTR